jgi:carbon-monoxide dehydrogenase medium subunit
MGICIRIRGRVVTCPIVGRWLGLDDSSFVKPTAFRYSKPETLDETLRLLTEVGDDAALLAGGQSLVPMMNLRLVQVANLIDLNGLHELDSVSSKDGVLRIGALTRQRALERRPDLGAVAPLLAQAMPHVAHPSIRSRGTVGGSIAHADPSAELATVLVATGGRVTLARAGSSRTVPADEFLLGPYMSTREPDELLVHVELPLPQADEVAVFTELARKPGDFALVLVAVVLQRQDGRCTGARVAVGGAGPVPARAPEAEAALLAGASFRDAAATAASELEVSGDVHGSEQYRRRMVGVLVRRALEAAA